jgi:hypothetical protein
MDVHEDLHRSSDKCVCGPAQRVREIGELSDEITKLAGI